MDDHDRAIARIELFWGLAFKRRQDPKPKVEIYVADEGFDRGATFSMAEYPDRLFGVRWSYSPGGDRASWDDGWWPSFFVVVQRRRGFIPWKRPTEVPLYWNSGDRTLEGQLEAL